MDRYIIREPRAGVYYPEGNQMISFPTTNSGSTLGMYDPQNMYYTYGPETQGYVPHVTHGSVVPPAQIIGHNNQGQVVAGIDPRYLAAYSDSNVPFIATATLPESAARPHINIDKQNTSNTQSTKVETKPPETNLVKKDQNQNKTRVAKIQGIQKTGTRVFCGSVKKILKWKKSLQDIGVMVLYELVGICVSIEPGDRLAKNLVVRDERGPAMQVVYYEMDLLLPAFTLPCTVRVVGRMLAGSNRMQGFSVRVATADDVTALSRRSTVSMNQHEDLIKYYGGCH